MASGGSTLSNNISVKIPERISKPDHSKNEAEIATSVFNYLGTRFASSFEVFPPKDLSKIGTAAKALKQDFDELMAEALKQGLKK